VPNAPRALERATPPATAGPAPASEPAATAGPRTAVVVEYVAVPDQDTAADEDAPPLSAIDALQRTRNGLAKRPTRNRSANEAPVAAPAERPEVMDESPDELRNRLMSLRAGVLRGRAESGTEESVER
jgi:hypothetical protein